LPGAARPREEEGVLIDIYCHIYPDRFFQHMTEASPRLENIGKRLRGVTKLFDLDARFREMDGFGDYKQIISLPNPPIDDIAAGETAQTLARVGNDAMAELCARHRDRFPTFVAAVALTDVEAAISECHRAINELGARGVQIFTNIAGRPLDLPEFRPFFATMAAFDLPIWLHPARTASMPDYPAEQKSRYEMWWCFGWPYDTSVAMSRLVFSGLFDRHPGIKIITHHLGGMVPYFDGRVGAGMEVLGSRTSDEDYSQVLTALKRPHLDYFHEFYADTALFGGRHGLSCGLDFFGADHVVFATDTPLGPIRPTIEALERLALLPEERDKISAVNAAKLLKMKFN
jgi:predicted TIM-barrel fold metal-dependent hydrolase